MKKIGIFGVNGFIGHHLVRKVLEETDWLIVGSDIDDSRLHEFRDNDRFEFRVIDIREDLEAAETLVKDVEIVLPLAAIATPSTYIERPIYVFELDFEANLRIVRFTLNHKKRLIWPSTSEVYGMCTDDYFNPETSNLILGPIAKERWIYSSAKQLMDRVVFAYGKHESLDFTIFRPFNWLGAGLDNIHNVGESNARAITQFLGNMLLDKDIVLVDGGSQRRSFTYVDDGLAALIKIIDNKNGVATNKIYNIGNPKNNISIKEFAEITLKEAANYPVFAEHLKNVKLVTKDATSHYGDSYQDMFTRVPDIDATMEDLDWVPEIDTRGAIQATLAEYQSQLSKK